MCLLVLLAAPAQAQDLKSILSGVVKTVGEKVSNNASVSLVGTWKYAGQDCKFTSDNLLAQAGGEIASSKIEAKMDEVMKKIGFTDGCTFVFNADSTFTTTVKGKTTKGTYTYDASSKELKMSTRLKISFTATVAYNITEPNKVSLLFKADKLMNMVKAIGGSSALSSVSSSLKTVSTLLEQYDGLQVGFVLEKQ